MNLTDFYSRLETEFELDIPEEAEEKLTNVRDVRDYIREAYRVQGTELPSGLIFERIRRIIAVLAKTDATAIKPETKLSEIESSEPTRAWI